MGSRPRGRAAIGSGLIGGTFFAFSAFVMRALGRLPAAQGIAAMRSINLVALNPVFLGVLVGTAGVSLLLVLGAGARLNAPASAWSFAGAALYLVGTFGVTALRNVPLNDALAAAAPEAVEAFWSRYQREWTLWNAVRTLAATGALLAFVLGLLRLPPEG